MKKRVFGMVLALLLVLAVAGAGQASSAPVAQVGGEYTAVSVPGWHETLPGATGAYGATLTLVDAQSNLFVGAKNENPANNNQTWAEIARYNPQGVETGRWYVNPVDGWKIDGVSVFWSGTGVEVVMSVHKIVIPRERDIQHWLIQGIFANSAGLALQAGGAGVFQAEPQPSNEPVDYDRVRSIIHEEVQASMNTIIANMIPKTTIALGNAKVLTEPMFYGSQGSYSVWRQLTDTSFTGALGAIRAYYATPTATAVRP